ncbi:hypothetical protein [Anaeromicropila herbilytica]|uniref:Uncharacterized protein n=1 Tax=Anaeromicropila herbilytica TaxID=2785025 RepID=A0A7R7IDM2_9FIRM|nr:hypothetical protein [Anaeromicropila herbilytica]BCN31863.1 hypothetical protein bsdtb5_31580 [Anaeromicropila herbilytica]
MTITAKVGATAFFTAVDIYNTTDTERPKDIIAIHPNPHPECPLGSIIHDVLESPYERIGDSIVQAMKKEMLIDLVQTVKETRPDWLEVVRPT